MISVIIPVYNVEPYLCECLDSVIAQTYTDLEIIVVDDGSTDGSGAICDAYIEKDSRIKVIHQENQGLSGARNTGLDLMTGEYVAFLDSDDYLLPDALEHLLMLCRENEADMSVCPFLRLEADGSIEPYRNHAPINGTEVFSGPDKMHSYIRMGKQTNSVCGKLYVSKLFQNVRFPVGKTSEDVFVSYRVIHSAKRLVINEVAKYVYRNRPNSIMTRPCTIKDFDVIEGRLLEQAFITQYYPELVSKMDMKICSAALTLVVRTAVHKFSDPGIDKKLQSVLRDKLKSFLKNTHNRKRKIIAVLAACNIRLARAFVLACRRVRPDSFSKI